MDSWIETYSGIKVNLVNPYPSTIRITDIAHSLSMLCRYTGHTKQFYSVAQHSVYVSLLVPPPQKLPALLHDSAEAYLGDVSTPLKHLLPDYARLEYRMWRTIIEKYGLEEIDVDYRAIKCADNDMLNVEAKTLMDNVDGWGLPKYTQFKFTLLSSQIWSPATAETNFLMSFSEYFEARQKPDGKGERFR